MGLLSRCLARSATLRNRMIILTIDITLVKLLYFSQSIVANDFSVSFVTRRVAFVFSSGNSISSVEEFSSISDDCVCLHHNSSGPINHLEFRSSSGFCGRHAMSAGFTSVLTYDH